MVQAGNSNTITRNYLDSLLIETRYMNSTNPDTTFTLYGETFASPIMTAALSHLRLIEIIKPYTNRDIIYKKIRHAESLGLMAVGIDIDHPFANDGSPDIVDGEELKALTTAELAEIVKSTNLPLITKGVLSLYDADISLQAGVKGMVLSHHNNRIEYAIPPVYLLPEVCKLAGEDVPVFVDGAYTKAKAQGVSDYLKNARDELAKAMAYTGCTDLGKMDPSVIHVVK